MTISVVYDADDKCYFATVNGRERYGGMSKDEALGYAIREIWLGQVSDTVPSFTLDYPITPA